MPNQHKAITEIIDAMNRVVKSIEGIGPAGVTKEEWEAVAHTRAIYLAGETTGLYESSAVESFSDNKLTELKEEYQVYEEFDSAEERLLGLAKLNFARAQKVAANNPQLSEADKFRYSEYLVVAKGYLGAAIELYQTGSDKLSKFQLDPKQLQA